MTFFVACIVLDEQRISAGRRDICLCFKVPEEENDEECHTEREIPPRRMRETPKEHAADRIMAAYARFLLRPWVKATVIVAFATLFGLCSWSATKFSQEFNFTDMLPRDSYVTKFTETSDSFNDEGPVTVGLYFRYVDFSDPEIQSQMQDYLDDLAELDFVEEIKQFNWMKHFNRNVRVASLQDLSFEEQMAEFLSVPIYHEMYYRDIALDEFGNVTATRIYVTLDVNVNDVEDQINALKSMRRVTLSQPINQGKDDMPFFAYEGIFKIWEFFSIAVKELTLTTVVGVVAVTLVAFIFIPHWSAALIVFPLIIVLYIDLIGVMQWAGIHINAVSYVALAMSIGLLVDFVMHILFRYYESSGTRTEKTIEMLTTMGASILLGGTTTFLGTIPLMFCTSAIFETIFYAFLGIVTLGMGHGLILLPVLLSIFGTEDQISMTFTKKEKKQIALVKEEEEIEEVIRLQRNFEIKC